MEDATLCQLATYELDGETYAVDVLNVREIIRIPPITRVPNSPGYVLGVINLRGKVIPVISLRRRFQIADEEENAKQRIIVTEAGGELVGFLVDGVHEVMRIRTSEMAPAPEIANQEQSRDCIRGVLATSNGLVMVIDLDKLFLRDENGVFAKI